MACAALLIVLVYLLVFLYCLLFEAGTYTIKIIMFTVCFLIAWQFVALVIQLIRELTEDEIEEMEIKHGKEE